MKHSRRFACAALLLAVPLWAGGRRVAARPKPFRSIALPPEAQKKGVQGNVVIVGEVTAAGKTANLRVVKSTSPLLTQTAVNEAKSWEFEPATEDGRPVGVSLNAIVKFRSGAFDRTARHVPAEFDGPVVGDIRATPADASGKAVGPDGFPVETGDGGISGVVMIDLPRSQGGRAHRVAVTDRLPGGRTVRLFDGNTSPGPGDPYALEIPYHRAIKPSDPAERGVHALLVSVDGRDAGEGVYRVGR